MKKLILIFICSFVSHLKAQTLYVPGGAAGIGNLTPLRIYPSSNAGTNGALKLQFVPQTAGSIIQANSDLAWADHDIFINAANSQGGNTNQFVLFRNGNVGIGTATPADQFEIVSGIRKVGLNTMIPSVTTGGILSLSRTDGVKTVYLGASSSVDSDAVIFGQGGGTEMRLVSAGTSSAGFGFYTNIDMSSSFGPRSSLSPVMKIFGNGNVGIGTAAASSFKLAVNGKIWTQEVNVAMTNPGPDYVFEKNYDLLSLTEVETYINQNKHLPEVPSAQEMEKDGLNLKEMNLILLKKVEELTLHLIEANKKAEIQHKEIKELQKAIKKG
jgi:hypothetical protein